MKTHPLTFVVGQTDPTDGSRLATLALTLRGDTASGAPELVQQLELTSRPLRERLAETMKLATVPTLEHIIATPALHVQFAMMGRIRQPVRKIGL